MSGRECLRILRKHGISRDEFAGMMGIKRSTMRTCVYGNRISRKMVARLMEMEGEEEIREEIAEVDAMIEEAKKEPSVIEGVIRQTMDNPSKRMGKIYAVPRNRYLRLVEDWLNLRMGVVELKHGRFRCKPDQYLKLGDVIELKHLDLSFWTRIKAEEWWEIVK